MQRYRFKTETLHADDPRLEAALAAAYAGKYRPLCNCTPDGVPMYIARIAENYVIKRMPNSGNRHGFDCSSFEPPAELSGLGEVAGAAIREDVESGMTTLQLDFALSKGGGKTPPPASGDSPPTVRTDGSKLTLRGLLHHLWDEAQLNRWTPGMMERRNWYVVRTSLLKAAVSSKAKGEQLSQLLYVPETFNLDHKDSIARRRFEALRRLSETRGSTRQLMLIICEVKEVSAARFGFKVIAKHLPDTPLYLPADLHKRLAKRFERELALWNADTSNHLLMVATFGYDAASNLTIEEASLTLATSMWIPVEHTWEMELLDTLTREHRRFTKGLRYNLHDARPLASAVLSDTAGGPTALYITPPTANATFTQELDTLIEESTVRAWQWHAGTEPLPPLPAIGA